MKTAGCPAVFYGSIIGGSFKNVDPSAAESSFTFSDGVGYGTAITVGGKTYELVKDERDVTNRSNEAVVVTDLTDLDAVAKGFADAINGVAEKKTNADGNNIDIGDTTSKSLSQQAVLGGGKGQAIVSGILGNRDFLASTKNLISANYFTTSQGNLQVGGAKGLC